jgi:ubiquinone/menaquinone biosynthesis C-methylase UbiE
MPVLRENAVEPAPFDSIAAVYDDAFTDSAIGRAQRRIVWSEMDRVFHPGQRILEINCGTGIDALHLADRGVHVDACDSAPGMIARAEQRADSHSLRSRTRFRCVPTERIDQLLSEGPYDGVLSNFGGLDCVSDLERVAHNLAGLVRAGGRAVLCVFGSFCLWETVWYLSAGNSRKAFRRLRRGGVEATLAPNATVTVHYRRIRSMRRVFAPYFRLERWRGVGVAVPPSYAESLAVKFPHLFRFAAEIDPVFGRCPAVRCLADHVLLTFVRIGE